MLTSQCSPLPDERSWRFDEISAAEPQRAAVLEEAEPPTLLRGELRSEFGSAFAADKVRWGLEQACGQPEDLRAVVQFPVAPTFFDKFFNARTGYRAHFRAHYECGLRFNAEIIDLLRVSFNITLPEVVIGRQLNCEFKDAGPAQIDKAFLMASLSPDLSKVWFCTKLIEPGGAIRLLPPGLSGPRILLEEDQSWAAPYRNAVDTWLDVKGAFLGRSGAYQPKDPTIRAKKLQIEGVA